MANEKNIINNGFREHPERINRNGRPRKIPSLDKILADVLSRENKGGISEAEQLILKLLREGKKGNVRAAEIILDRGYGKPKQIVEATNTNLNAELTEEQLNQRLIDLMNKAGEDDGDSAGTN